MDADYEGSVWGDRKDPFVRVLLPRKKGGGMMVSLMYLEGGESVMTIRRDLVARLAREVARIENPEAVGEEVQA